MNFLLRSTHTVAAERPYVNDAPIEPHYMPTTTTTLEGLIAEDPYSQYSTAKDCDEEVDRFGGENGIVAGHSSKNDPPTEERHLDVSEEEGWIIIPYKEFPDNWNDAPDICSLRSLDRPFVFSGEQIHILACLSAFKQDTEIITPFKVAAVMSKNGMRQSPKKLNGNMEDGTHSLSGTEVSPDGQDIDQNDGDLSREKIDPDPEKVVSASESLLRLEDHRRQTETLLQRFKNSHFFVRIAESGERLWSKKSAPERPPKYAEINGHKSSSFRRRESVKNMPQLNTIIDRGNFNANVCGGMARNTVNCFPLSNGDIVVLLQVNVGVNFTRDPVIEILQFQKYQDRNISSDNQDNLVYANHDPYGELLKWLLPLENTLPSPSRSLSPPPLSSNSGIRSTSHKSSFSTSSSSQLFSFGHFRSHSLSSLPQNTAPAPPPVTTPSSKPNFDLEDWDRFSPKKFVKSKKTGSEGLLSFRSVSLEPGRFSVCCGLEGIYIPGRRWRRKLEVIQPVEIHSFAADCNTDDLLCVQIKNVSPAHTPNIVVYIDAITIVIEEASKCGPPLSPSIACIEAGKDHSLPNLALRRGEEHSFILKPAISMWKDLNAHGERSSQPSHLQAGNAASSLHLPSKTVEGKKSVSTSDQYAIMVSCRCNYTESRLFFKQQTSWQPRISRDIMISVATEMSIPSPGPHGRDSHLPVQVLTLQASNLSSKDLTFTVLAPASFTSPPSVVSLNSSPPSPISPFVGFPEFTGKVIVIPMQRLSSAPVVSHNQKQDGDGRVRSVSFHKQAAIIPSTGLSCTHLWLHSRVPLGCVPSQSTATIKLELLPLTDGIITLDTLQIDVKEKGLTYAPEHSLKINAISIISTGII